MQDILQAIKGRRSIRTYTKDIPPDNLINAVIEAGRWAPSGLNNQPWRFVIIRDTAKISAIAGFTKYFATVRSAPVLIVVFLDAERSYNRDKDLQAIGACIQNMLLAIGSLGLGACWLGEILNKRLQVSKYIGVPDTFELMAVLSIGYPKSKKPQASRIAASKLIHKTL